jgi:ubiquinone/menaquinone biosynthesis C-methylase UbiE
VVYSNTVLEHVPQSAIPGIFAEACRVLKPGGFLLHLIDMSDHFSHTDSSITSINFLTFSEKAFRRYNTQFLYQNRLRVTDWRRIVEEGALIRVWQTNVNKKALEHLPYLRIGDSFKGLSPNDLCTSSVVVVAQKRRDNDSDVTSSS